jgi:NTP pyrophosphatase (non-canonical NTP hydrolase)
VARDLNEIQAEVQRFRDERGWEKFHDPASLAAAINVEAGELLELFLWKDAEDSLEFARNNADRVSDELADIMIFTINLANRLEIDLEASIETKIALNAERFPTDGHGDSPPSRKNLTDS